MIITYIHINLFCWLIIYSIFINFLEPQQNDVAAEQQTERFSLYIDSKLVNKFQHFLDALLMLLSSYYVYCIFILVIIRYIIYYINYSYFCNKNKVEYLHSFYTFNCNNLFILIEIY